MWNETVEHENAGNGWAAGESSFMTDRKPDSKATTLGERLPVPVTISNLIEHFSAQDDKYVVGTFRFATVLTVGIVKDISQDGTTYTYDLCDPNNTEMEYRTLKYDNEGSTFDHSSIVEGTRVRAIGKLKGFDGNNTIMLFNITPVEDDKDFTIFELEAEAARLFFQKNVSEKLKSVDSDGFQGMLAPPKSRMSQTSHQSSQGSDTKERLYAQPQKVMTGANQGDVLRERITAVLMAVPEGSRDEGRHVSWIAEQIQETNISIVRKCVGEMVENGLVYTTVDEETVSAI
ncbi:Replication protein A C-terminal domain-containing protein [Caenorhabditis elegans]|uniref:Replication protein A C-terminal domain-containing protein n=1 Tax=Caenorhabditis elegans TaxID=6239 RepID=Q95Y97_CAEEL|nr:Replication protein A C-terminal domain-containing protein [Caenorhabditis elegans]CCD64225.1 Replication protein A C-terminal domain-containing protein [Caenorhabditis elegans]|eukprot:NP_491446.1 Replication Protein A homolog [Caenorhabditis elegans]